VVGATVASEVTADRQRGLPPLCSPPEHAIMPVMLPPPIMPNLYASLGRKAQCVAGARREHDGARACAGRLVLGSLSGSERML
jgi:hypothetical protein